MRARIDASHVPLYNRQNGELHGRQRSGHGQPGRGGVHPPERQQPERVHARGAQPVTGGARQAAARSAVRGAPGGRCARQPGPQPPHRASAVRDAGRVPQAHRPKLSVAPRSVPWWAIATCIVATETSTLTFIGAPGTAYRGDWTFLQLVLGYIIGRLLIAVLFIPAYFRGEIYTSYELLQRRFGGAVRTVSAAIFLLYRTLGDGIRLHAAALVLAVAAGIAEWWCIVLLGVAMILYTEE